MNLLRLALLHRHEASVAFSKALDRLYKHERLTGKELLLAESRQFRYMTICHIVGQLRSPYPNHKKAGERRMRDYLKQ